MSKVWGVLFLALLWLVSNTRASSAHAFLLRTDPPDGSVLASSPSQMRLWFSEPPEIELTTISLQDGDSNTWQLEPHADPTDPSVVMVDLPELQPGAYHVTWRTVSDEDLHVISGFIVFGIQQSVSREGSRQVRYATPFAEIAFHWINLLAFASALGALVVILFLLPLLQKRTSEEQAGVLVSLKNKMIWSSLWCNGIAFSAGLLMIWDKFNGVGASSFQAFMSIDYVRREFASEACLIAIAFTILYWIKTTGTTQRNPAKMQNVILFSGALVWIILQALNSHASAFNDFSIARVLTYAFHLLGAALWIGGQVALIFLVAPRLRHARVEQVALAREIYVQFGYTAALGVAILIVTGIYSAGQQVASLDALLLTDYGRALIVKSTIFLLAGFIGLQHASHFHPKVASVFNRLVQTLTARSLFHKANPAITLRIEALGGAAIFLLAAYLGSTQPARGPEFDAPAQESVQGTQPLSLSGMADDLLVNFSIKPNQPGQNFITVGVFNTRRPQPAPIEQVTVRLQPPGKQDAIQLDAALSEKEGTYQTPTGAIDLLGEWKISVIVHRAGLQDAHLELPWQVNPSLPRVISRPVWISNRPLAPLLTVMSLLLSIAFAGAWLALTLKPDLLPGKDNQVASLPQEMYQ